MAMLMIKLPDLQLPSRHSPDDLLHDSPTDYCVGGGCKVVVGSSFSVWMVLETAFSTVLSIMGY